MEHASFSDYARLTVEQVVTQLKSSVQNGLSTQQAKELKKTYGPNIILVAQHTWKDILLRQFKSPFVYIFVLIAFPSLFLHEYVNAFFILLCVVINTTVGFYQEYKAHKNVQLLRKFLISLVTTIRDGHQQTIESSQLVPGDIIIVRPGNVLPADVRFTKLENITVDESALTGESKAISKTTDALTEVQAIDIFNAKNIGFKGTTIITGTAHAVVVTTGDATAFGSVVHLTGSTVQESNFAKNIARLGNFVLYLIFATITVTFILNALRGTGQTYTELFLFGMALAIGVIPEALPVVVTFSLSRGALLLAQQKVIVKRLSALEDLGSVEVICTDKTGTLTQNSLEVADVWGDDKQAVLFNALLAHETPAQDLQKEGKGFDNALWKQLTPDEQTHFASYTQIAEVPFDPVRRRNLVVLQKDTDYFLITRGMFEEVILHAKEQKPPLNAWALQHSLLGNRVIAVGYKKLSKEEAVTINESIDEQGITLLGGIAFSDPIKDTAKQAVYQARQLGLIIKILSGDSKEVCRAVAKNIGLITDEDQVITGLEFAALKEEQKLRVVQTHAVFARVLPEQKYEIISMLQQKWQVGYLGDGINDTPALQKADISMVVQEAVDVARETADIILLKKSLLVIVQGVIAGRKIIANTLKYIKITLACALGNLYTLSLASLVVDYPPMLPLHLILLSALSDLPMLALATDTVSFEEIKKPQHYSTHTIIVYSSLFGLVSSLFDFMFFGIFKSYGAAILQTGWFIESMLAELLFAFSGRTKRFIFKASPPSAMLTGLSLLLGAASVIIPLTSFGQRWLQFTQLTANQLGIIFALVLCYFGACEITKYFYNKYINGYE